MASSEREPIKGSGGRAPSGVQRQSPWSGNQGGEARPEAENFLRIGHPKEGANWPHVHVLNERNCNFRERGLMGTIWGAPEATHIRLLYAKGIKLILPSTLA